MAGIPRDTQWKRRQEIERIQDAARHQAETLVKDPFWVGGVMLYWAEGGKTKRMLTITNTDPALLRTFMAWVRSFLIEDPVFVLSLHLHEGNSESRAKSHWRDVLALPRAEFWKSYIKPAGTGHRKNIHAQGVCRVVVRNGTDAWLRTMTWIDSVADIRWESR